MRKAPIALLSAAALVCAMLVLGAGTSGATGPTFNVPASGASISGTNAEVDVSAPSNTTAVNFFVWGDGYGFSGPQIGTGTNAGPWGWYLYWNTNTVYNGSGDYVAEVVTTTGTTWISEPVTISNTAPSAPFPVAVWLQNPDQTTQIESGYSTLAAAAKAEGINTFLGLYDWPSAYGVDNSTGGQGAQFQAACNAGEYVMAGGDPSSNTSASSVASVDAIAASETQSGTGASCTKYLAGYNWTDEPNECTANVAAEVAAIHADDSTRPTLENEASWVTWGDSGCTSTANANFAAPDITSSDDYHNTDPWNATNFEGGCKGAENVSTSPWLDCSWLYGYQAAMQLSLSSKPTWVFVETGTDELGFSSQNGSSCNTTTNACANGNEYNATAPQVNADAWASVINGATGIEWFCHGTAQGQNLSDSDCMGGSGSASNAIFTNLYRANGSTTGTFTVSGEGNKTATLVYDSAAQYDPSLSEQGDTFSLNSGGAFSDALTGDNGAGSNHYGAGANGYQVKIYAIK